MPEPLDQLASGILALRAPVNTGRGISAALFCERWGFRNDQGLGFSLIESRGPVSRTLFAVAFGAPVNDAAAPTGESAEILALIPIENVLGFVASKTAPEGVLQLDSEAVPA